MTSASRPILLGLLILSATACLVLGLTLPIIRLSRLYFWTDTHSIISVLIDLYGAGEYFLASVIFVFSIVFPFFKLLYLFAIHTTLPPSGGRRGRMLKRLGWLGKWSMLDVLVLALIVFYAKSTRLADAVSMPGVYLFTAAVVLTMVAYGLVEREGSRAERRPERGAAASGPEAISRGNGSAMPLEGVLRQ